MKGMNDDVMMTDLPGNKTRFDEDTVDLAGNHIFTNFSNVCCISHKPKK